MKPLLDSEQPAKPSSENAQPIAETRLLQEALTLVVELRELGYAHFRLAALEMQRAGVSLVTIMVAGIMLAVLLIIIGFGLMAAIVVGLAEHGITLSSAFLLAIAFSLMLVLILIRVIRRASRYLLFPVISGKLQSASNRDLNDQQATERE